MTTLIPIGRFSKMTRLSAKALRLYDEMRLLVPARVDPATGYRYYTHAQVKRAVIIGALRAVEMPLDEIRAFVSTDDEAAADRWLRAHRTRIERRLNAHQEMLALIDAYVGHKPSLTADEVELVARTAFTVVAVRVHTSHQFIGQDVPSGFAGLSRGLAEHKLITVGPPMLVVHDLIDEQNDGDIEIAVPVDAAALTRSLADRDTSRARKRSISELYASVLPACTLATIVHRGPFSDVAAAYRSVFEWIHARGLDIVGPAREVYLTDPTTVASANLLSRVEVPVALTADGALAAG